MNQPMDALNVHIPGFSPFKLHTSALAAIMCSSVTLITLMHSLTSFQRSRLGQWPPVSRLRKSFTVRNRVTIRSEDHFLSPITQRREKLANPVPKKAFLQLSSNFLQS